jgi:hypothetical protein
METFEKSVFSKKLFYINILVVSLGAIREFTIGFSKIGIGCLLFFIKLYK